MAIYFSNVFSGARGIYVERHGVVGRIWTGQRPPPGRAQPVRRCARIHRPRDFPGTSRKPRQADCSHPRPVCVQLDWQLGARSLGRGAKCRLGWPQGNYCL